MNEQNRPLGAPREVRVDDPFFHRFLMWQRIEAELKDDFTDDEEELEMEGEGDDVIE